MRRHGRLKAHFHKTSGGFTIAANGKVEDRDGG